MNEKQLAQARPSNTNATSVYSPTTRATIIKSVVICNTTDIGVTFRIFVDDDGTTYDESTAVFWDAAIAPNTTVEVCTYWPMDNPSGNLAVRTNTSSAITFTFFGAEL